MMHKQTADMSRSRNALVKPELVRQELSRILESQEFAATPRRRKLLQYLVEELLAGRGDSIKGYTIGVNAFGRDEDFDPDADPVVRLEARRLRHDLDSYYASEGRDDPLRISVPKGRYLPHIEWQYSPQETESTPPPISASGAVNRKVHMPKYWPVVGLAGLGLFVLLLWGGSAYWSQKVAEKSAGGGPLQEVPNGPSIAVLPFLNLSGDSQKQYISDGISEQLATELTRFRGLWVMPLGSVGRHGDGFIDIAQLHEQFGMDYALEGSVRVHNDSIKITSRLVDANSARYVWVRTFSRSLSVAGIYEVQDAIAEEVAANLAGKYGFVAQEAMTRSKRKAPNSFEAYDCVLRYYDYQISIGPEQFREVKACLEQAVHEEPEYAEAWAVLSNVYMQQLRFGYGDHEASDIVGKALGAAKSAITLDPQLATAHSTLSNILYSMGDFAGFHDAGKAALRLNSNDSDALAHYGLRLSFRGEWERGLGLIDKAMALNPVYPDWYHFSRVAFLYGQGDFTSALAELDKIDMPDFLWTHLFRAATLARLERPDEAGDAVDRLLQLSGDFERNGLQRIEAWHFVQPLRQDIIDGLIGAGLTFSQAGPQETH